MYNNELQHHGVKGMHWGVRRYQNYDGSLTSAGQKRYGVAINRNRSMASMNDNAYKQFANKKGLANKALAKTYAINRDYYNRKADKLQIKSDTIDDKHVQKMSKKKERLVNSSAKRAESANKKFNESLNNVKDLRKNGTKSQAYKDWKATTDRERARKYARDNAVEIDGKTYYRNSYENSWSKTINDVFDYSESSNRVKQLLEQNTNSMKTYNQQAKHWASVNSELMNMPISEFTTKQDFKKIYKK